MSGFARARRFVAAVVFPIGFAACGGSSPTTTTPPSTTPATVTVTVGDGQQGGPGAAVSVNPTVTVKNAAGLPVAGVTVTFSVDSGGGTLTGATTVTNASGVATLGGWTLGPTEGRNVLRIVVAGLAPVFAVATASVPATGQVADVTIGAGGGSITTSNAPLAGLALTIPSGAFAGSGTWNVEYLPASSGPQNPAFRVAGPVIAITTTQGMANQLMTLRIPVHVSADSFALAWYYDPATGYLEPLPIVASDANSITVGTRHFSLSLLAEPASGSGSLRTPFTSLGALRDPGLRVMVVTTMQAAGALVGQVPAVSDFVPGTDTWEFADHGSYLTPNGNPTGVALSELYYYFSLKPPLYLGTALSGKYDQGPFWADDPLGYRIAALAENDVGWPQAASIIQSMPIVGDGAEYHALLGAISYSKRPVLVSLSGPNGTIVLVAYQVNANEVLAADPNNPGLPVHIRYIDNQFQPVQVPGCGGTCPRSYTIFHAIGVSALVNERRSGIGTRFAQLPNGPVGAQEFPAYTLQYYDQVSGVFADLTTNALEVGWQNLQLRAKCFSCEQTLPGGMAALSIYDAGANLLASDQVQGSVQFTIGAGNVKIGVHVLGGVTDPLGSGTLWRHVDFQYITISSSKISISPNPANGLSGVPLTLTATNVATSPAQVRYTWNFNDGNVATVDNSNTVSHPWAGAGTYPVSVVVKDLVTGGTVGSASGTVQIDQPVPVWRFNTYAATGYSQPDLMYNLNYYGYAYGDAATDAHFIDLLPGTPGSGLLIFQSSAVTVGNTTYPAGLYLQFAGIGFPRTGFDPATAEVRAMIVGGSVGSLTSGTYAGQNIIRVFPTQGLPFSGKPETMWTISATKNGTQISGTITWTEHVWDTFVVNSFFLGDIVRTYTFTATRIK